MSSRADPIAAAGTADAVAGARTLTSSAAVMTSRRMAAELNAMAVAELRGDVARYVTWYSGPSPPSGGVSRPPLAVIAPHCTQFDGFTIRST